MKIGFEVVFLLALIAGCTESRIEFPYSKVPSDVEEKARAHLMNHLEEIYSSPSSYSFLDETVKLVGSQELVLDDRDGSNGILEQWCLVFSYEIQAEDPDRVLLDHRVYQINEKSSGWFPIPIYNYSEESSYWQYISDTWERCLGY